MNFQPDAKMTPFAARLWTIMAARKLTAVGVGKLAGVEHTTVGRWLRGSTPSHDTGVRLARKLGVEPEWLLDGRQVLREQAYKRFSALDALRLEMEDAGIDSRELAKIIGYQIGVVQAVVEGRARASENMIEAICRALPGLDKESLMMGSDSTSVVKEDGTEAPLGTKPRIQLPPGTKARYVPLLSWAQAGQYQVGHTDEAYDQTGVLALDVDDARAFALEIAGDSMSPRINQGDRVIVAPSWTPRAGDTVIVRTLDGDVYCKTLLKNSGDKIVLASTNTSHKDFELSRDEIAWIYPVAQVTQNLRRQ
jgi:phage repressor protein C with HTH and peptisase S24 domain